MATTPSQTLETLKDESILIEQCRQSCELVLKRVRGHFKKEKDIGNQDFIFTAGPKSQFYEQIWTRDTSLAIINIVAKKYPLEAYNTLNLIFDYQKDDGTLPIRVEGNRHWMRYIPILRELTVFVHRKKLFAVYTNRLHSPEPRDDIPMSILAWQELIPLLSQDEKLLDLRWEQLIKAVQKEESFECGGLVSGERFQDWVDSIHRKGKLSNINILFCRALEAMSVIAYQLRKNNEAEDFADKAKSYREKIMQTFWEKDGYFKASSRDTRFDAFANILAILYLDIPHQAVKIQDYIKAKHIFHNGLLKNFDRPYPADLISKVAKLGKMEDYHNHYSWPWITCMNIIAKLKIVSDHPDNEIKARFRKEALEDFIGVSKIFKDYGFCEILDEKTELPVSKQYDLWIFKINSYKSSPDFLISATVYLQALENLIDHNLLQNIAGKIIINFNPAISKI